MYSWSIFAEKFRHVFEYMAAKPCRDLATQLPPKTVSENTTCRVEQRKHYPGTVDFLMKVPDRNTVAGNFYWCIEGRSSDRISRPGVFAGTDKSMP